jgi:hypothetical protein
MNLKISLLSVVIMTLPVCLQAQTARNPLNFEPAQVTLQQRLSSWKLSEENFYCADGTAFDKRTYLYDENGRKTADVTLRRDESDGGWRNTMLCEYRYDGEKEVVTVKADRQSASKTEITSDAEGKPVSSLTYQWNDLAEDWAATPTLRCEWAYKNGLATACLKQHKNRETGDWNTSDARILYFYGETGALTEELYQSWNPEANQWTDCGKYTYINMGERQKTAASYINASGNWVSDGKTVYLYDEEGKIIRCDYYKKDTDEAYNAYSINTYSELAGIPKTIEANEVSVYPNPAVSSFELTVSSELTGNTAYLFDLSGEQVKSVPVSNLQTQIIVNGLPSGVYMLKIADISKRVIIK